MQANRKYIYFSKLTLIYILPRSKNQNAANLRLQTFEKKPVNFLWHCTRVNIKPEIILLTEVPFQRFPFL